MRDQQFHMWWNRMWKIRDHEIFVREYSCSLNLREEYIPIPDLEEYTCSYNSFCLWKHQVFPQTKSIVCFIAMQTYKELTPIPENKNIRLQNAVLFISPINKLI